MSGTISATIDHPPRPGAPPGGIEQSEVIRQALRAYYEDTTLDVELPDREESAYRELLTLTRGGGRSERTSPRRSSPSGRPAEIGYPTRNLRTAEPGRPHRAGPDLAGGLHPCLLTRGGEFGCIGVRFTASRCPLIQPTIFPPSTAWSAGRNGGPTDGNDPFHSVLSQSEVPR